MRFTPKTNEEMETEKLSNIILEPGVYGFEVIKAIDKVSKSGNEMIELILKFYGRGQETIVFDYLVSTDKAAWKIKNFCDATGLTEEYKIGLLTPQDCIGRSGLAELIIQRDDSKAYPDKNSVKQYIEKEDALAKPAPIDFDDDSIPF